MYMIWLGWVLWYINQCTLFNAKSSLYIHSICIPGSCRIDTVVWMHYMDTNKTAGEEARWQLHKNAASNIEQVQAATPHKAPTIRPPASHHEKYPS